MMYQLIIRKKAEKQIHEAFDWYEKQKGKLGEEFLISIESALKIIEKKPGIFQKKHKEIRCKLLLRFPFGVFYFIDGRKIIVVSVFHLSRNPRHWKT